jgi:hypothetical protein
LGVEAGKDVLVIHPGLALNCEGEEVGVPQPVEMALTGSRRSVYLTLHYTERETDPLPVAGTEEMAQNSRIEETYVLNYQQENPCPGRRRKKTPMPTLRKIARDSSGQNGFRGRPLEDRRPFSAS